MISIGNKSLVGASVGGKEVLELSNGSEVIWQKSAIDPSLQAVLDYSVSKGYVEATGPNVMLMNDHLVVPLKTAGIWAKLDVLFVFANDGDDNFRSINYIDPNNSGSPSSLINSKHGFVGQGASPSFFDTNFNPNTDGVNYTLNNASRGVWLFKASESGNQTIDSASTNQNIMLNQNVGSHRINSGTAGAPSGSLNMAGLGFKSINRVSLGSVVLYNGKTQLSYLRDSSALSNANQHLLRSGTNYSSAGISLYYMGASLTQAENNTLADIFQDFINQLGPVAPVLDSTSKEIVQGSSNTVSATVPVGETVVWKDDTGALLYSGNVFSIPSIAEGNFQYYAYAVNSASIESEPTVVDIEVKSVDNTVLVTPMHRYSEVGEDVVIASIPVPGIDIEYYDSTDALIQTGGDLTLTGLAEGTHEYYALPKSGATSYQPVPITVITLATYPTIDYDTQYKLGIADGVPDENLMYNEEVQPMKSRVFPKNTVVNNIVLNNPGYRFSPRAISVIMDSEKEITFTANAN